MRLMSPMRALPLAGALACLAPTLARAEAWTTDSAQGITEYRVDTAQGDEFNLSCDVEASGKGGEGTAILVTLAGKDPAPRSKVTVTLDNGTFSLDVDAAGMIGTDCKSCAEQFKALWAKLRTAHAMRVRYADGTSAAFSLEGASTVLPASPCKTGFDQ